MNGLLVRNGSRRMAWQMLAKAGVRPDCRALDVPSGHHNRDECSFGGRELTRPVDDAPVRSDRG
jgi:hypothetical protein